MGWFSNTFGNGSAVARIWNGAKNWFRGAAGKIRSVAGAVSSGARALSFLPGIGLIAGGIGSVADGVSFGVDVASKVFDFGESIQKSLGLDLGNGSNVQAAAPALNPSRPMGNPSAGVAPPAKVNAGRAAIFNNRPVITPRRRIPVSG